jgi:hypothetical protein
MYRLLVNNSEGEQIIKAPFVGTITQVNIAVGDVVTPGKTLFVFEAMKMENRILSTSAGKVTQLNVSAGSTVTDSEILAVIEGSNDWQDMDIGDDVIALTYSVNDIAELKSRNANRSNSVKLPRSHKNDLIFGVPFDPNSSTRSPYRYIDCRVFEDGVELFGKGAKLKLMETNTKEHAVAFYGSLFDLFAEMKNKPIKELNLGFSNWDSMTIAYSNGSSNPFYINELIAFPIIEWYIENDPPFSRLLPITPIIVQSNRIYPAISFKKLLERILQDFGYTLELPERIANDSRYTDAVIPFATMQISEATKETARAGKAWGDVDHPSVYLADSYHFKYGTGRFSTVKINDVTYYAKFDVITTGSYTFLCKINITQIHNTTLTYEAYIGNAAEPFFRQNVSGGSIDIAHVVDLQATEHARFYVLVPYANSVTFQVEISCIKLETEAAAFNLPVNIASNLPDVTCNELFTLLAQQWCLIPEVDELHKVLRFWSFEKLYENKKLGLAAGIENGTIKDWSNKLDDREHQTAYKWNSYGQSNIIQYKEEDGARETENNLKINSKGIFTINDETLDRDKTLFELAAAATQETTHYGVNMAIINAGGGNPDIKLKYLVLKRVEGKHWSFKFGSESEYTVPDAWAAEFTPVGMEVMIGEYNTVAKGLLNRARLMVEKFNLSPLDLANFDHSIPVYLSKYSCCFYVNKINNYIPGRLTEVELVPLRN